MTEHLIGLAGLAARWGVTQQRVSQLAAEPSFPERVPIEGSAVKAWRWEDCEIWKAERDWNSPRRRVQFR